MEKVFTGDKDLLPHDLATYQDYVVDFLYKPRSVVSLYRRLINKTTNIDMDLSDTLNKNRIALYDFTLIVKDMHSTGFSTIRPLDVFFAFYEKLLIDKGICVINCCHTTYGDSEYLLLRDDMNNMYRLFIKSEEEHLRYKLGNIIDEDGILSYEDVDDVDPRDAYNTKIKVYRKDGSEMYIDEGSTVLDFAFAIHSEIGLHFHYALIDDSLTQMPPYTRLSFGDKITVITKEEKTADTVV